MGKTEGDLPFAVEHEILKGTDADRHPDEMISVGWISHRESSRPGSVMPIDAGGLRHGSGWKKREQPAQKVGENVSGSAIQGEQINAGE